MVKSALHLKAMCGANRHVCFGPKADIGTTQCGVCTTPITDTCQSTQQAATHFGAYCISPLPKDQSSRPESTRLIQTSSFLTRARSWISSAMLRKNLFFASTDLPPTQVTLIMMRPGEYCIPQYPSC